MGVKKKETEKVEILTRQTATEREFEASSDLLGLIFK